MRNNDEFLDEWIEFLGNRMCDPAYIAFNRLIFDSTLSSKIFRFRLPPNIPYGFAYSEWFSIEQPDGHLKAADFFDNIIFRSLASKINKGYIPMRDLENHCKNMGPGEMVLLGCPCHLHHDQIHIIDSLGGDAYLFRDNSEQIIIDFGWFVFPGHLDGNRAARTFFSFDNWVQGSSRSKDFVVVGW